MTVLRQTSLYHPLQLYSNSCAPEKVLYLLGSLVASICFARKETDSAKAATMLLTANTIWRKWLIKISALPIKKKKIQSFSRVNSQILELIKNHSPL